MKLQIILKSIYFCKGNIPFEHYFFKKHKRKSEAQTISLSLYSWNMLFISTLKIYSVSIFFSKIQEK